MRRIKTDEGGGTERWRETDREDEGVERDGERPTEGKRQTETGWGER